MALSVIRQMLDEEYNALQLLDALPLHDSMTWLPYTFAGAADPPEALVIGSNHDRSRHILAYLAQHGDKARHLRYCSIPINGRVNSATVHNMSQEEVMQARLNEPFNHNAAQSKSSKRKSSIVIRFYFMKKGLWTEGLAGDYNDYCKRFHDALRRIEAGRPKDGTRSPRRRLQGSYKVPVRVDEVPEPEEARTPARRTQSGPVANIAERMRPPTIPAESRQLATPVETPAEALSVTENPENADYDTLCQYLDDYGALYLLQNIPDADKVEFVSQGSNPHIPEAMPKKLFIGRVTESDSEIYAYMRPNRNMHEINFWVEDPLRPLHKFSMKAEDVMKQRIIHPFNKAYPKDGNGVEQGDKARFSLMVKWYFVAAGIAIDVVLKETKAYPERLRSALEYIAMRMGPAAVERPESAQQSPTQQLFDESHIQSDLARSPPRATPTPGPSGTNHANASASPRGTKRKPSVDATWDAVHRTGEQERALTRQINGIDEELELLDIENENREKRRKEMEIEQQSWERRRMETLDRRAALDGKRRLVRKQHQRLSISAALGDD